ncbi:MAG: RNA polymerase sigma factor, partial [Phycisphaerae bacterium]
DDVLSETLVALFQAYQAGRYDRGRGRFRAWVFGIAMNKVREVRARAARQRAHESPESSAPEPAAWTSDADFDADIERTLACQCLDAVRARVAPLTYQAFDLYAMKGRSAEDVSRMLGVDKSAVYVAKSRVLSSARKEYEGLRALDQEV